MRRRRTAPLLAGALALIVLALAGCGTAKRDTRASSDTLTIYTALPLQGASAGRARDVLRGEKLALDQMEGRAGLYSINFRTLNDAGRDGYWDPAATVEAARGAAADGTTIAYLGDLDAGATALSIPTTNASGVLQLGPGATYDGFTSRFGAFPGEPEKYYPSGRRTFVRIPPADSAQAERQVGVMRAQRCERLATITAPSAFDQALARQVGEAAEREGITVVAREQVGPDPEDQREVAEKVTRAGAGCVAYAGTLPDDPARLFRVLHAADPDLTLIAPMALADASFAAALGPAADRTRIIGPAPPPSSFVSAFRREYGEDPGPWAYAGWVAMRTVLDAIAGAGNKGNDRLEIIARVVANAPRPIPPAVWKPTAEGLRPS